jgi:hypothetical protein
MKIAPDDSRSRLLAGIRSRRQEIEKAVLGRVHAIGPGGSGDPEYLDGLRLATEAAIDHTIQALEDRLGPDLPVPSPLLSQARLAARRRVPLDVILRRYLAGSAVLGDFLMEEAERQTVSAGTARRVLRLQATTTDQAVAVIGATYLTEATAIRPRSNDERRAELVGRLLDGELIDPAPLNYAFDRWHLAIVIRGLAEARDIDDVIAVFDVSRLAIAPAKDSLWLWLGARDRLDPRRIEDAVKSRLPGDDCIAIGEPAEGQTGWRLTHEQAQAALTVAIRRSGATVRYADVALLATAVQDDLLATSLHRLYMDPLAEERDGGALLRNTLRAYFAAEQNISSAGAVLGVDRRTVSSRLRAIEARIDSSLDKCAGDLQVALKLEELSQAP